jgi:hypothetical protein
MDDDYTAFGDLIPDGALPMYGFLIVAYMDPEDGVVYDDYRPIGEMTTRDAIGTLEATKFRIQCAQWSVVTEDDD